MWAWHWVGVARVWYKQSEDHCDVIINEHGYGNQHLIEHFC